MTLNNKFRFGYSKADRNGIFVFCLILVIGVIINYFSLNSFSDSSNEMVFTKAEDSIQKLIDELKIKQSKAQARKIYPFNPNFINPYKGYTLEMTVEQIDRLEKFRAKNYWINSKSQFQEVTQVSDDWMTKYGQFFKFPDWVLEARKRDMCSRSSKTLSYEDKKDLNSVSKSELMQVNGIGKTLADRIIKYRESLGGFVDCIQLKDVYGLKANVIENLKDEIALKSPVVIQKKDINTISIVDLTEVPYFNYEVARSIFDFIKLRERIHDFKELSKIDNFPAHKLDRIQLYLEIKQ